MYPEMMVLVAILIGFLAILLYQAVLAIWPWIHIGYSWVYRGKIYRLNMNVDGSPYQDMRGYASIDQYPTIDDPVIKNVALRLNSMCKGLSDRQKADFLLKFVQCNIRYTDDSRWSDSGELWRFPIDTLRTRRGDCEDSAFLYTALAYHCGIDVATIDMKGHISCGVAVKAFGKKYEMDGKMFYRAETTSAFFNYVGINISTNEVVYSLIRPVLPDKEFKEGLRPIE